MPFRRTIALFATKAAPTNNPGYFDKNPNVSLRPLRLCALCVNNGCQLMPDTVKPILIFTWGNPSRGDDAIGPQMYERLTGEDLDDVDLLTDFQLQIEHTMDLQNRERIVFIDASVSAKEPFEFYRIEPAVDDSYTTHAMSPESLLATYEKVNGSAPPPAYMLAVRGYGFELGQPVSEQASTNLADAFGFIRELVAGHAADDWDRLLRR
jgi:hydrogenase maturation protease